jgi:hypothetical protein
MKTDKVKGLKIWTEKVGSNYIIKCETVKGDNIVFPHSISRISEIFKEVVEILSTVSWEGVDTSNISEEHLKAYKEARFLTSKI